jgi:hypothetical protein
MVMMFVGGVMSVLDGLPYKTLRREFVVPAGTLLGVILLMES